MCGIYDVCDVMCTSSIYMWWVGMVHICCDCSEMLTCAVNMWYVHIYTCVCVRVEVCDICVVWVYILFLGEVLLTCLAQLWVLTYTEELLILSHSHSPVGHGHGNTVPGAMETLGEKGLRNWSPSIQQHQILFCDALSLKNIPWFIITSSSYR